MLAEDGELSNSHFSGLRVRKIIQKRGGARFLFYNAIGAVIEAIIIHQYNIMIVDGSLANTDGIRIVSLSTQVTTHKPYNVLEIVLVI